MYTLISTTAADCDLVTKCLPVVNFLRSNSIGDDHFTCKPSHFGIPDNDRADRPLSRCRPRSVTLLFSLGLSVLIAMLKGRSDIWLPLQILCLLLLMAVLRMVLSSCVNGWDIPKYYWGLLSLVNFVRGQEATHYSNTCCLVIQKYNTCHRDSGS